MDFWRSTSMGSTRARHQTSIRREVLQITRVGIVALGREVDGCLAMEVASEGGSLSADRAMLRTIANTALKFLLGQG